MPITRRGFLRGLGAGSAGLVLSPSLGARELHASLSGLTPLSRMAGPIQLDRNENPFGPGRHVLEAIQAAFGDASRYPDDPESTWPLDGASVKVVTFSDGDGDSLEVRFDTPEGRGSFWETLRRAGASTARRAQAGSR